jgi:hypothetical protein
VLRRARAAVREVRHRRSFAGWVSYAYNSLDGRRQMVVLINTDSMPAKRSRALGRLYTTAFCG